MQQWGTKFVIDLQQILAILVGAKFGNNSCHPGS